MNLVKTQNLKYLRAQLPWPRKHFSTCRQFNGGGPEEDIDEWFEQFEYDAKAYTWREHKKLAQAPGICDDVDGLTFIP